jgi:hypothetical protein
MFYPTFSARPITRRTVPCDTRTDAEQTRDAFYHRRPPDLRCHPAQPLCWGCPSQQRRLLAPHIASWLDQRHARTRAGHISILIMRITSIVLLIENQTRYKMLKACKIQLYFINSVDHIPQIVCNISQRWCLSLSHVLVRYVFNPFPALLSFRISSGQRQALARVSSVPEHADHALSPRAEVHSASRRDFLNWRSRPSRW